MELVCLAGMTKNFYPRPPRGGRPSFLVSAAVCFGISIHALREEGDFQLLPVLDPGGGFLSTPSARRATRDRFLLHEGQGYFYPRPPRGGRPIDYAAKVKHEQFLSTPSARRATGWPQCRAPAYPYFYPRPPRGGRRLLGHPNFCWQHHFYPRPPRGGRHRFFKEATE